MLDHDLVLKANELYLVGNTRTDGSRERATGLYARDTRHLSRFLIRLNGARLETLATRVIGGKRAMVIQSNPVLEMPDGSCLPPQKLLVEQRISLNDALGLELVIQNFDRAPASLTLSFEIAADFRDLFDIRGFPRAGRGRWHPPRWDERHVVLAYEGLDGAVAETEIEFGRAIDCEPVRFDLASDQPSPRLPAPGVDSATVEAGLLRVPGVAARFHLFLGPGEQSMTGVVIKPRPADGRGLSSGKWTSENAPVRVVTDDESFNWVLRECLDDLDLLQTAFPHGELPAAGIPWFVAPFGRDSLIVGLQTLYLAPERAAGTLRVLGALQGKIVDPEREEEPGRILHEMRYGEMARLGEVPHTPYYGTVDATPLFVWLFAETVIWTGDAAFYDELLPNAKRALEWIERFGDLDGDGFVKYRTDGHGTGRITHQVWKDSSDSLHHVDGTPASGPIAAVEVQGYVYAAYARLAAAAAVHGDEAFAGELRAKAERNRAAVEDAFWMPDEGYYAQALDGEKRQVKSISSNPGHILAARLPTAERAAAVARRFAEEDLDSGWGIRTLSSKAATFNPISYHNGSVWPHDNSLLAAGLYAYGHADAAHRIFRALVDAALTDPQRRLPELFCGFPRMGGADDEPVRYPVTCSPQAWAAGSIPFLLRAALGLEVEPGKGELRVAPMLPDWLASVEIAGLCALGQVGALSVRRRGGEYEIGGEGLPIAASSSSRK